VVFHKIAVCSKVGIPGKGQKAGGVLPDKKLLPKVLFDKGVPQGADACHDDTTPQAAPGDIAQDRSQVHALLRDGKTGQAKDQAAEAASEDPGQGISKEPHGDSRKEPCGQVASEGTCHELEE
jgi:hypothetical protein